ILVDFKRLQSNDDQLKVFDIDWSNEKYEPDIIKKVLCFLHHGKLKLATKEQCTMLMWAGKMFIWEMNQYVHNCEIIQFIEILCLLSLEGNEGNNIIQSIFMWTQELPNPFKDSKFINNLLSSHIPDQYKIGLLSMDISFKPCAELYKDKLLSLMRSSNGDRDILLNDNLYPKEFYQDFKEDIIKDGRRIICLTNNNNMINRQKDDLPPLCHIKVSKCGFTSGEIEIGLSLLFLPFVYKKWINKRKRYRIINIIKQYVHVCFYTGVNQPIYIHLSDTSGEDDSTYNIICGSPPFELNRLIEIQFKIKVKNINLTTDNCSKYQIFVQYDDLLTHLYSCVVEKNINESSLSREYLALFN
ncbi:MAG: hypothetical protein M0R03_19890, partial [Novosphingobium sp.]|nr:hypothetical protein [Novosphingobium sp.]